LSRLAKCRLTLYTDTGCTLKSQYSGLPKDELFTITCDAL
jgi:hypothetical protein